MRARFVFEERIKKLSTKASIEDKIKNWRLIGEKAADLYHSKKHSEAWVNSVYKRYANKWRKLYDEIRYTPEFIEYRKYHDIADDLSFGDFLA